MSYLIDNTIAVRIIFLLTLPFEKWEAFKSGIIDKDGNIISDKKDDDNWTMLHRLIARLKIMLGKIPGGKSQFATFAAAYLLVKENREIPSFSEYVALKECYERLIEDEPSNNVTNVAGIKPGDEPPAKGKRNVKRNKVGNACVASGRTIIQS
jgi:hypothetical protein